MGYGGCNCSFLQTNPLNKSQTDMSRSRMTLHDRQFQNISVYVNSVVFGKVDVFDFFLGQQLVLDQSDHSALCRTCLFYMKIFLT